MDYCHCCMQHMIKVGASFFLLFLGKIWLDTSFEVSVWPNLVTHSINGILIQL